MPFEAFSEERLERLLLRHPVTSQGRSYISEALAAPHRNALGTTKNVVTDVPCPKMKFNIQSELKTVHAPQIRAHVFCHHTTGFLTFPPPLELVYQNEKGKTIRTRRQIDCLVFDDETGVWIETWARRKNASRKKDDADDDSEGDTEGNAEDDLPDSALLGVAEAARKLGFSYRDIPADSISATRDRNHRYLWTYLYPQAAGHYAAQLDNLLALFGNETCCYFADLERRGSSPDLLHWAIAYGHVHVDFDDIELGQDNEKVLVFRHSDGLKAWQLTHRSAAARPVPRNHARANELRPGDHIVFDGKPLTVSMAGTTALHTVDSAGNYVELPLVVLTANNLVLPEHLSKPTAPGPLWKASARQLNSSIRALEILQRLDRGEPLTLEQQRSASTLRRWRKTIREGLANGQTAIEALVNQSDRRGFHGPHINLLLSEKIDKHIRERLKDRKKESISAEFTDLKEIIGDGMIARSSFYERWNLLRDLKSIAAQEGHRAAYQQSPVHWQLHLDTPVHARRALELVHLDSTLLDIVVISSLSGEVLGRPWLTLAMCAVTRRVVGMHLSFRPPSYISSMSVLADIVRRFGRLPDSVIHDWGSEFKSKDFKHALTALCIERHIRPKAAARFGSCLERMFGVTLTELIHNSAGNTKMTKKVRQLTKQIDPSTHSGLTLLNLLESLEAYFFTIYDTRKHPTTLCSPRNGFDVSLLTDGLRPHRLAKLDNIHPLLCPMARTKPPAVDRARGVFVNYQQYGHPLFADTRQHEDVLLKPVVDDPSVIYAFVGGEWRICRAASFTDMQHLPVSVKRCIYEELWYEQKLITASHAEARVKVRELLNKLNQQALDNCEYFRDRKLAPLLSVASVDASPAPSSSSFVKAESFVSMMRTAAANIMANQQYGALAGAST